MIVGGVVVEVTGAEIPEEAEIQAYIDRAKEKFGVAPQTMSVEVVGDEVNLNYSFPAVNFTRLRRITGYLVGDLNRWNNGKRAEERDRVKHV